MKRRLLVTGAMIIGALCTSPAYAAGPGNDDFDDATTLTAPSVVPGSLTGATTEPGEEAICYSESAAIRTVWYRFSVDVPTPVNVAFRVSGSYLPAANFYAGSTLSDLDWFGCGSGGDFIALPGRTYFIQVFDGGYISPVQEFTLSLGLGAQPFVGCPFFLCAAGAAVVAEADGGVARVGAGVPLVSGSVFGGYHTGGGGAAGACLGVFIVGGCHTQPLPPHGP